MYRLVIVSGPNRGSSFNLIEGENSIGRQMDSHIVLTSSKVSKRHCSLMVTPNEVFFRDDGSTNGTFVNGALTKKQTIKPGDKIGVGEFVLELAKTGAPVHIAAQYPPMTMGSSALAHQPAMAMGMPAQHQQPMLSAVPQFNSEREAVEEPQDLPGKVSFAFENKAMPFFYGMLMKNEYRAIVAVLFALLTAISVTGSIMPMQDLAENAIKTEARTRAKLLSRELADRNLPMIASHTESQIDLSLWEGDETVKLAVITNTNLQIIAPQSRLNQLFAGGREAAFAMVVAKAFREGEGRGIGAFVDDHTAVWIEPIRTMDSKQMKPQISGMAIVSIDFSNNLIADGGLGVTYGIGFCIAGLAALIVYFILLRLTLRPYEVLNDDIDQVLRGELPKATHEFKISELDGLWDNINAALQRIPKNGGGGADFSGDEAPVNWALELAAVRAVAESSGYGFLAFDSQLKVVAMNEQFEEMSGIRAEAIGQTLSQMARDQSFVLLIQSLLDKAGTSPTRSSTDQTEFSGVMYDAIGAGVGPARDTGITIVFKKKG